MEEKATKIALLTALQQAFAEIPLGPASEPPPSSIINADISGNQEGRIRIAAIQRHNRMTVNLKLFPQSVVSGERTSPPKEEEMQCGDIMTDVVKRVITRARLTSVDADNHDISPPMNQYRFRYEGTDSFFDASISKKLLQIPMAVIELNREQDLGALQSAIAAELDALQPPKPKELKPGGKDLQRAGVDLGVQ